MVHLPCEATQRCTMAGRDEARVLEELWQEQEHKRHGRRVNKALRCEVPNAHKFWSLHATQRLACACAAWQQQLQALLAVDCTSA